VYSGLSSRVTFLFAITIVSKFSEYEQLKIHEIYIHIHHLCNNGSKIKDWQEESQDLRTSTQENVDNLVSDTEGY